MKFLVDAQLPLHLAEFLERAGHDVLHTSSLLDGNASTDRQVIAVAENEGRVVVTKDVDFRDAHLLRGVPSRLLLVRTGNISNAELFDLLREHLVAVVASLEEVRFVELGLTTLVVHDDPPEL